METLDQEDHVAIEILSKLKNNLQEIMEEMTCELNGFSNINCIKLTVKETGI